MTQKRLWSWLTTLIAATMVLAACGGGTPPAQAPTAAPAATEAPAATAAAPAAATEAPAATAAPAATTEAPAATAAAPAATGGRGAGDTLRILYWQAPTILNIHLATGTKDYDAGRLILEPLASIPADGQPVPILAAEIPTIENGGVASDLTSVTWKLKQGVKWHDGSDFTAEDVVFTYEYCADEKTACVTASTFAGIESVEALDDYTVKITWAAPTAYQYKTFTSSNGLILQKAQFENCIGEKAATDSACQAANLAPIGTGPYKLREFKPGDVVVYDFNPDYHEEGKPFFKEVQFKGGGDAPSAARAVFQTGDVDWAWNLQVEAAVLNQLVSTGGKGVLVPYPTSNVERLIVNFTNVDPDLGDARGELGNPHPFLTDPVVRQALALAIDRKAIAEQLYGPTGSATCELLGYPPYIATEEIFTRKNCVQNLEEANKILDEAGWVKGSDGVRAKDGVRLSILFQTSVNSLRQKTQELIKANWEAIGVETELKSVDAGVFFGSDAGNPDNIGHFFTDIQMYTTGATDPDPTSHFCQWVSSEAAQKANEWRGNNNGRWQNEEYDQLCEQLQAETDPEKRIEVALAMNDLVVGDNALIPLVARARVAGAANNLKGYSPSGWDSEMWSVKDWYRE